MKAGTRTKLAAIFLALLGCAFGEDKLPDTLPVLWRVPTGGTDMDASPAIGPDGTIYAASSGAPAFTDPHGGRLTAFTQQGVRKWTFPTFMEIRSSPAVGADGIIYFGCRDRKLHAVTPDGKEKWSFATGAWVDSSPAIGTNGVIYFGGWDKFFYALNPDGTMKWTFATGGPIDSSPAIGADGTIYFGSHDHKFYALNPDGTVKWTFATEGAIVSSPAIGRDGTLYFASVDGRLYAVKADGSEAWHFWTGGVGEFSSVLGPDEQIYIAGGESFQAISPDGKKLWENFNENGRAGAVAADGTVFFGCPSGVIHGYTADGRFNYRISLEGLQVRAPLRIVPDGIIYVGLGPTLFALKGTQPPASSSWPSFRGNARQNGRVSTAETPAK